MSMLTLTIDGRTLKVKDGTSVLDAARGHGIAIPTLCHHPKLTPFGGCRLCLVQIEGVPRPLSACTTPVSEGMTVTTSTPEIEGLRKTVVELLVSDHPNDCMTCERAGDCTLQGLAYTYGVKIGSLGGQRRRYEKRDGNPFIERDMEKCVMCGRCVRVCDEVQGVGAIDFAYRGFTAKICPPFERDLDCEFCGQCVAVCPTGALVGKAWAGKGRKEDFREVDTVCPYCGTGCNITLQINKNRLARVTSKPGTWNEGWLCVKGRFGYGFLHSPERLKTPLIKEGGKFREATWDEALGLVAKKLRETKEKHGPDAVAGLSSARCTNEENYLFQKMMRAAVGTNNVDHCARL